MQKVIVIGCPGAGKSTFARKLQKKTGLPLYYLDRIWHNPDKANISKEEFDRQLSQILRREAWIIDGNYSRTLEMRLKQCDTVFLLDYPLEVCLAGAQARVGAAREDMPWIEDTLDPEFREWIEHFGDEQLPGIYRLLEQYRGRVIVFHSRAEAEAYLHGGENT